MREPPSISPEPDFPSRACKRCRLPLPADAPHGLCPRCLARAVVVGFPASASADAEAPAAWFGPFELLREAGRGGAGVVFRARDSRSGKDVALKILTAGRFASARDLERLSREAQAVAALKHPGIVEMVDVGGVEGSAYLAMEWIDGLTLSETLRRTLPEPMESARVLREAALAVQHAHDQGVLHRDLKPSNILIDALGCPRLTDFGLARLTREERNLTRTSDALGTPGYMPPEQLRGDHDLLGPASDVYGLGAVLYFLLTGRAPFLAASSHEAALRTLRDEPAPPRRLNPAIPAALELICLKCLEKNPNERFASAADLAAELERFLHGEPILTRRANPVRRLWRWCQRRPTAAATLLGFGLIVSVATLGLILQWREAVTARTEAEAKNIELAATLRDVRRVQAEEAFEKHQSPLGIAWLAKLLRDESSNAALGERLAAAIESRKFGMLAGPPLRVGANANQVVFSSDRSRIAVATTDGDISGRVLDSSSLAQLARVEMRGAPRVAAFSGSGLLAAFGSSRGEVRVTDEATGIEIGPPLPHPGMISAIALSADGRFLAVASHLQETAPAPRYERLLSVWSLEGNVELAARRPHPGYITHVGFSPDGKRVVSSTTHRTATVFDLERMEQSFPPLRHQSAVMRAVFNPDGSLLAAVEADARTVVWRGRDGIAVSTNASHRREITGVRFSADGKWVATSSADGTAVIFDAGTGIARTPLLKHEGGVNDLAWSPDDRTLATAGADRTVRLWDALDGSPLAAPFQHKSPVRYLAFGPDGNRLSTVTVDGHLFHWDLRSALRGPVEMVRLDSPMAVRFADRDQAVVQATPSGLNRVSAATGRLLASSPKPASPLAHALASEDGSRILVRAAGAWYWELWDSRAMKRLAEDVPVIRGVADPIFSADSARLVALGGDDTFWIFDGGTGSKLGNLSGIQTQLDGVFMRFSPDGNWFFADAPYRDATALWNVPSRRLRVDEVLSLTNSPTAGEFDRQSRYFALAESKGAVFLFDLTGFKPAIELRHPFPARHLAFSPDGQWLLTAADDHALRGWRTRDGRLGFGPIQLPGAQAAIRISADGRRALTIGRDHVVRVWSMPEGTNVIELPRHNSDILFSEFTPDAQRLVTAAQDGWIRVWETETGHPISEPMFAGGPLLMAQLSGDGRTMLTTAETGPARLWSLAPLPEPLPAWFPDLAEGLAGLRITSGNHLEHLPPENFLQIREERLRDPSTNHWAVWARHFLARAGDAAKQKH